MEENGVDIAEEVRKHLEKLVWKIKIRKFVEKWDEILKDVKPSEPGFAVKSIREDRESH